MEPLNTASCYKEEISPNIIMSDTRLGEAVPKLFPSQGSKLVFVSYMMMFVAQGMLVTGSRHGEATPTTRSLWSS